MVCSLDGFIAKKDGSVSWLQSTDKYDKGVRLSDEEITKFLEGIDCYIMGSQTYLSALQLGWPYGEKPVVVLTSRKLPADRENVSFYKGDLRDFVDQRLRPKYQHIWMAGGGEVTKSFLQEHLADEIVVSIMPVLLGDGTLFFDYIGIEQKLHLINVTAYQDGMVEMQYQIVQN